VSGRLGAEQYWELSKSREAEYAVRLARPVVFPDWADLAVATGSRWLSAMRTGCFPEAAILFAK
jgi:hypothetical protein